MSFSISALISSIFFLIRSLSYGYFAMLTGLEWLLTCKCQFIIFLLKQAESVAEQYYGWVLLFSNKQKWLSIHHRSCSDTFATASGVTWVLNRPILSFFLPLSHK